MMAWVAPQGNTRGTNLAPVAPIRLRPWPVALWCMEAAGSREASRSGCQPGKAARQRWPLRTHGRASQPRAQSGSSMHGAVHMEVSLRVCVPALASGRARQPPRRAPPTSRGIFLSFWSMPPGSDMLACSGGCCLTYALHPDPQPTARPHQL